MDVTRYPGPRAAPIFDQSLFLFQLVFIVEIALPSLILRRVEAFFDFFLLCSGYFSFGLWHPHAPGDSCRFLLPQPVCLIVTEKAPLWPISFKRPLVAYPISSHWFLNIMMGHRLPLENHLPSRDETADSFALVCSRGFSPCSSTRTKLFCLAGFFLGWFPLAGTLASPYLRTVFRPFSLVFS